MPSALRCLQTHLSNEDGTVAPICLTLFGMTRFEALTFPSLLRQFAHELEVEEEKLLD
jgi:hypothetical protein